MKLTMKLIVLTILMIFLVGCSVKQDKNISDIHDILLDEQDLQQLKITGDPNNPDLDQLGIILDEKACHTEKYETDDRSPLAQQSICSYIIDDLNNTQIILQLSRFTNLKDLNGSYQYESSHYYSSEGLLAENDLGDQSRFRVNNEHDYGGQYNDLDIYYYHLWITKDLCLIHITSKGSKEAKKYIEKTGKHILSKFE